jgi:hypothetical protein
MTHSAKRPKAGRGYFMDEKGVRLPSVTTILNATKPQEARDSLDRWRQRVGVSEAMRISGAASRRGTLTHKQIKSYLLERVEPPCPEDAQPYWNSVKPVLGKIDQVRLVESTVFHYDLGYAGKVDCVASYDGIPCICDWKTADRPKGSIERLYDNPLQLAAYCGAVNHGLSSDDAPLNHALLVVALPEQPAEIFWFQPEAMRDYWQQWQERVALFYHRRY